MLVVETAKIFLVRYIISAIENGIVMGVRRVDASTYSGNGKYNDSTDYDGSRR